MRGCKMKKLLAIQITALVLFSGALGGMYAFTDVYDEVYSRIVSVICLSCIKLNRVYAQDYMIETANGKPHPNFIIEDLTEAPIFLAFRTDVCAYCDDMEPLVMQIFNIKFEKEDVLRDVVNFNGTDVIFYHVNNDHATGELKTLQPHYDIDGDNAVPMFTMISLNYHRGIVTPYYLSVYGILNPDYTDEERIEELKNIIFSAIELFNENSQGFRPEDFIK
jgi:hypothetical protein